MVVVVMVVVVGCTLRRREVGGRWQALGLNLVVAAAGCVCRQRV